MTDIFELAQAWLEQSEYFEYDTAEKWYEDAEDAEKAIKRAIDTAPRAKELQEAHEYIGVAHEAMKAQGAEISLIRDLNRARELVGNALSDYDSDG